MRGSSSANFRKQSLSVEAWGENDDDAVIQPLGLPPESDWGLYGPSPEFDHTLLHNTFIDELSRQIGRYAVRFQFVEDALYAPNFTDPEIGYRAYIDVGSFVDHALLTNLALSFDALQLSTYMFRRSENDKYIPFLGLDLLAEMVDVNPSLYTRVEFSIDGAMPSFDALQLKKGAGGGLQFDLTGDGVVDRLDVDKLVLNILGTRYGDANSDGRFDTRDIVAVLAAGRYRTGQPAGFAEGDWSGDGFFTSEDIVLVLLAGGFAG